MTHSAAAGQALPAAGAGAPSPTIGGAGSTALAVRNLPVLYRGLVTPLADVGEHAFIREDRRPRDTGKKVLFNICFNLMIERRFGVPLVRRRSLFVSGDLATAARYAAVADAQHIGIVEPVGSFRCLHGPLIRDSASLADDLGDRYADCFYGWQREICAPLLQDTGLTLAALEAFFASHPHVDSGGFAWGRSRLRDRIYAMLDGCFDSSRRYRVDYRIDEIDAAARAGVEIMIFDCPMGYRIRPVPAQWLQSLPARQQEPAKLPGWPAAGATEQAT